VIVCVIVYTHENMGMLCIRAAARVTWQVSPEARARRRELLLQSVTLLDEDVHASLLAQVHDCIADTYVSIPVVDLDQDFARQTPLGCVESYPSLHADTFVLPSSDKRQYCSKILYIVTLCSK